MPDPYARGRDAGGGRALYNLLTDAANQTDERLRLAHAGAFPELADERLRLAHAEALFPQQQQQQQQSSGGDWSNGTPSSCPPSPPREGGREDGVWRRGHVWTRGIWLHAWKYSSTEDAQVPWVYESQAPAWATAEFAQMTSLERMQMR